MAFSFVQKRSNKNFGVLRDSVDTVCERDNVQVTARVGQNVNHNMAPLCIRCR